MKLRHTLTSLFALAFSQFAFGIELDLQFTGNQGQSSIYRTAISGTQLQEIQAIELTDAKAGGGSDGVYSGFDLDFVILDRDGDLSTTNDQIFPIVANSTVSSGGIRNPQSTSFVPTSLRPGILFGLDAAGEIDASLATLSTRDAVFFPGNPVDSVSGWVTLGDGGRISISFPLTTLDSAEEIFLFVGEVGANNDEFLAATVEVFSGETSLEISTAVELRFVTQVGVTYQVQVSSDMTNWQNIGPAFPGTGNIVNRFFSTRDTDRRFFRLVND